MQQIKESTLREYERIWMDVRQFIDVNFNEDPRLWEFAHDMGYSVRSIQRALQFYCTSWQKMIFYKRVNMASKLLLETNLTARDIAMDVGYRPEQFSKAFRRHFGLTPRQYRQEFNAKGQHG